MKFVGGDVDHISAANRVVLAIEEDGAASRDDEDLMFVIMCMARRVAAGLDVNLPEGEVRSPIIATDHNGHGRPLDAFHLDFFRLNVFNVPNQHRVVLLYRV